MRNNYPSPGRQTPAQQAMDFFIVNLADDGRMLRYDLFLRNVTDQASLAKVLFLADLRIKPSFSLKRNARVRQNLRKGEHWPGQVYGAS
jgi:hypothetical protein